MLVREETLNWLKQAKEDFKTAKANLATERYYAAAFFSQQCAEKSLKAFLIEKTRKSESTHNLIELGRIAGMHKDAFQDLLELNTDYTVSRYPDAANGVPADAYNKEISEKKVACAQRVFDWVNKWISK